MSARPVSPLVPFALGLVALMAALVAVGVWQYRTGQRVAECYLKGGVMLQSYDGWICAAVRER